MLDKLHDRFSAILSRNHICVVSTSGSLGAWSVVAHYKHESLMVNCRLPRWSDAAYYLEQDPHILAIILDLKSEQLRWLQVRGVAHVVNSNDDRFVEVHITPERVDLIDESRGWGILETLEV